jgi:DNA-binding XRE family transcriptional regulator
LAVAIANVYGFSVDYCPLHRSQLITTFAFMNIKKKFGKKVKELRLNKGLSQEAFAHLADIDRTYISSIEKGERNVSIVVVERIAKALSVKISTLFDE